jgi:hypothetical protein
MYYDLLKFKLHLNSKEETIPKISKIKSELISY